MENKNNATAEGQLDFNAPLMSVRRISGSPTENEKVDSKVNGGSDSSSKPILPVYRSDLKSGPLRDPGTVPFVWEQTPGRPKDEQRARANFNCPSPRAPRLPPGRILSAKQSNIETPEPPKAKSDNEQRNGGFPSKHTNRASSKISANSNDAFASRRPCPGKPLEDDMDPDGCDDFSDAVETLSQTESAAVPYSVSVVSGMEGYDLRQSGRSVDPQTRNFMMDRFLPAAKAMASESPQQSSRRLPTKPITSGRESRGPSPLQSRPYPRKPRNKEKETDDIAVFSSKACGLFPRRLRSAFNSSPISQLSRMKKKKHFSLSPALNRRNSRGHLSDGDPLSDSDGETWEEIYRQKLVNGSQSTCYLRKGNETRAFSASASPEMGIMSRISCGSDSQTLNKFGTPTSGGISPYRNEPFRSPFSEGTGFLGFPKADKEDNTPGVESMRRSCNSLNDMGPEEDLCFWKSPPHLRNTTRAGSVSPTIEKTVYVDHVHKTRSSVVKPGYSNHNELVKGSESDFDVKSKPRHDDPDSCLVDSMKMLVVANVSDNLKSKILSDLLVWCLVSHIVQTKLMDLTTKNRALCW